MSGKIFEGLTIGIACVGAKSKTHNGCALRGNLIKFIQKHLCIGDIAEEYARLYAICIYLLIKDKLNEIESLIICNDEEFIYVKEYLIILLGGIPNFEIINITEFRKTFGRKLKSLADNFAKAYRKRALNKNKWEKGKALTVVNVDYKTIEEYWKKLDVRK